MTPVTTPPARRDFDGITTANVAALPPRRYYLFGGKIRTMLKFFVFEGAR